MTFEPPSIGAKNLRDKLQIGSVWLDEIIENMCKLITPLEESAHQGLWGTLSKHRGSILDYFHVDCWTLEIHRIFFYHWYNYLRTILMLGSPLMAPWKSPCFSFFKHILRCTNRMAFLISLKTKDKENLSQFQRHSKTLEHHFIGINMHLTTNGTRCSALKKILSLADVRIKYLCMILTFLEDRKNW